MGKKSREEVIKIIKNEISVKVKNNNELINSFIKETITDVTNEIVNKKTSTIKDVSSIENNFTAGNIVMDGEGGSITLDQINNVSKTIKAVDEIITSNESISELTSKTLNKIDTELSNRADVIAAAKQNAEIAKQLEQEKSKGIGDIIDGLAEKATKIFDKIGDAGRNDEKKVREEITNELKLDIESVNKVSNETTDSISRKLKNELKFETDNKCKSDLKVKNEVRIGDIKIGGSGNTISLKQENIVNALVDCIFKSVNTTKIAESIYGQTEATNKAINDNASKAKTDNDQIQKDIDTKKIKESDETLKDIAKTIKELGDAAAKNNPLAMIKDVVIYSVLGIGALIAIIVIVKALSSGKNKSSTRDYDDDDQEGGGDKDDFINIILIAILMIFILNILMKNKC